MAALPSASFWAGKRVLVTGHTGFKGAWLSILLSRLGATVTGLALQPPTVPSLFSLADVGGLITSYLCDIRDVASVMAVVKAARPECVFHLAAQSLVRRSYGNPFETFSTNVLGTAAVLDAVMQCKDVRAVVVVTTDKVYANQEWQWPYLEIDRLGGHDPYSASKAATELLVDSYRHSYLASANVAVATARAGNVIGGGDWAEDRLVPDVVKARQERRTLIIRNPSAVRPWQHVMEPLAGYLVLAERLWQDPALAAPYNFGPSSESCVSVQALLSELGRNMDGVRIAYDESASNLHEAGLLMLDASLSRDRLGVVPRWPLPVAVTRTARWYLEQAAGRSASDLCGDDIDAYLTTAAPSGESRAPGGGRLEPPT